MMTECETIIAEIWGEWWRVILLGLSGATCHITSTVTVTPDVILIDTIGGGERGRGNQSSSPTSPRAILIGKVRNISYEIFNV